MTPPWFEALREFWAGENFNPSGQTFLLAVSGGCDSVAMLELFSREVAPRFHCRLQSIHINHALRAASEEEQNFVIDLCKERGIPLHTVRLDPASRSRGQSLEMWGREQRYAAFRAAQQKHQADAILTAHHRDDVVETFCLRLWRGTGFTGMASIAFRRADGVLRPLLPIPRSELQGWLSDLGTGWREDESNADVAIPRNWVRHRLLPSWRGQEPDLEARIFSITQVTSKMLPLWDYWLHTTYPLQQVRDRGGIPLEWLRDPGLGGEIIGTEILRRSLPLLGVDNPVPELMAEILRQLGRVHHLGVRVNPETELLERNGLLVRVTTALGKKP